MDEPYTPEVRSRILAHRNYLKHQHGFIANPNLSTEQNFLITISKMPSKTYFSRPTNRQLHNLLSNGARPPASLTSLLGMGLNFCIKHDRPTNNIKNTFERLRRDIRRINFWNNVESDDSEYNPKLYISQHKLFDPASNLIECRINAFEVEYRRVQSRYNKPTPPILSPARLNLAAKQKLNNQTIVVTANKNLGPCILNRETYMSRAFTEHLGDFDTYAPLSDRACDSMMSLLRRTLEHWQTKFHSMLKKGDKLYLRTAMNLARDELAKF